jgi:indole-3-glycerol phosphate synthase
MEIDAKKQAMDYIHYGADAVSVLTDNCFFKGNFTDLEAVRQGIDAPILCKDFIIDSLQIDMAKSAGANIILLIVAAMNEVKIIELFQYAKKLGLEVLVEVHNEEELNVAVKTGAKLIGVNNRNLKTFEVDLAVTEKLGPLVKKSGAFLISESGIKTVEDVKRVVKAGANAILVGETFMKSDDLKEKFQELKIPIQGQEEK